MLGPVILAASRSDRMRRLISAAPVTKQVVDRFIPGETVADVVHVGGEQMQLAEFAHRDGLVA